MKFFAKLDNGFIEGLKGVIIYEILEEDDNERNLDLLGHLKNVKVKKDEDTIEVCKLDDTSLFTIKDILLSQSFISNDVLTVFVV